MATILALHDKLMRSS